MLRVVCGEGELTFTTTGGAPAVSPPTPAKLSTCTRPRRQGEFIGLKQQQSPWVIPTAAVS